MFRYQIDALRKAEAKIRLMPFYPGYVVMFGDDKIITAPTDRAQAVAWQRVITVNYALDLLGLPMSPTAGLLAQNTYSAFAYEVEK